MHFLILVTMLFNMTGIGKNDLWYGHVYFLNFYMTQPPKNNWYIWVSLSDVEYTGL